MHTEIFYEADNLKFCLGNLPSISEFANFEFFRESAEIFIAGVMDTGKSFLGCKVGEEHLDSSVIKKKIS